jgi:hypothetical protein
MRCGIEGWKAQGAAPNSFFKSGAFSTMVLSRTLPPGASSRFADFAYSSQTWRSYVLAAAQAAAIARDTRHAQSALGWHCCYCCCRTDLVSDEWRVDDHVVEAAVQLGVDRRSLLEVVLDKTGVVGPAFIQLHTHACMHTQMVNVEASSCLQWGRIATPARALTSKRRLAACSSFDSSEKNTDGVDRNAACERQWPSHDKLSMGGVEGGRAHARIWRAPELQPPWPRASRPSTSTGSASASPGCAR